MTEARASLTVMNGERIAFTSSSLTIGLVVKPHIPLPARTDRWVIGSGHGWCGS